MKILHLEDLPADAELVERELKKSTIQFKKLVVDNKRDFIKALDDFVPDVIISDHSLPSFDSTGALKIVKEKNIKTPFILVTATISEEFAVDVMKAGAHDYILKDRLQRLPSAILNALEKHRLEEERQKFLDKVIASEALLKQTEQLAHVGSLNFDIVTGKVEWSDEFYNILGYKVGEVEPSRENFIRRVHPDDVEEVSGKIDYGIADLNSISRNFRIRLDDGTIRNIISEFVIERDSNGKALRLKGYNQDITEIKQARELLEKSEANLTTVIENTDASIYSLDRNLRYITFNTILKNSLKQIYNLDIKQGDRVYDFLEKLNPDEAREWENVYARALTGESLQFIKEFNIGDFHSYISFSINPIWENKQVIGLTGFAYDISKQKLAEKEREKIIADIIQRNKDLEQFSYIISHNLRLPVANIIGLAAAVQNENLDADLKKEVMEGLSKSAKRLDDVIIDLNDILKVRREVSEKKEQVQFSELASNILSSIDNLVQKEKAIIVCDFNEVNEMLTLKSYLHSIFYNLISNSLKYRQPGVRLKLDIKSHKRDNKIELIFADNGLGIDLNRKGDQVFGLYKRFHMDHAEGKGMGLYMVKTQVETLGGKISVESEVNKGTIFKVEFET